MTIETINPLEQGLKLHFIKYIYFFSLIETINPLEQGLKLASPKKLEMLQGD